MQNSRVKRPRNTDALSRPLRLAGSMIILAGLCAPAFSADWIGSPGVDGPGSVAGSGGNGGKGGNGETGPAGRRGLHLARGLDPALGRLSRLRRPPDGQL